MLAKDLMHRLYGTDIYKGFTPPLSEDLQGWNSQAAVFVEAIETSQPAVIFDVGVWKGASTIFFAESLRERGLNAAVVSIDNFLGSVEHWGFSAGEDVLLRRRHGFPVLYEQFLSNVVRRGLQDYIVPLPQTSDAAAEILGICGISADIIHIDAAHDYESVLADARRYWKLLSPGGWLIGDDYHPTWPGVVRAADEFAVEQQTAIRVAGAKWVIRKPSPNPPGKPAPASADADTVTRSEAVETARRLAVEVAGPVRYDLSHKPVVEDAIAEPEAAAEEVSAADLERSRNEAREAQQRGDWAVAAGLWARIRTFAPDEPAAFAFGADALRNLGQLAEADAILAEGVDRFPSEIGLAAGFANLAAHRRAWGEALTRWSQFRSRFPEHPAGFVGAAWAFREQGQLDLADVLLEEALQRFPDHPHVLRDWAWVAHQRGDWREAASRWERVRTLSPDDPAAFAHGAEAHGNLEELDTAESILVLGVKRFPDDRGLIVGFAEAAVRHGDWTEALRRWVAARRLFPLDRHVQTRLFETRLRVVEAAPEGVPADTEFAAPEDRRMCEIMMACESLGGARFGCEFGGIQRAFGAEPIGLLRWADADPAHIIPALEQRFAGVGLPENTEVYTYGSGAAREYGTRDMRFNLAMHTFIDANSMTADAVLQSACRRLQFLRRKLIEDLESGAKLFVYKLTYATLTDEELNRLHAAVRGYGPATLLYVRCADADHPDGTVEWVKPGLLLGYIGHFGVTADDKPLAIPVESWGVICERAYALWKSEATNLDQNAVAVAPDLPSSTVGSPPTASCGLPDWQWNPQTMERLRREADDAAAGPMHRRIRQVIAAAGSAQREGLRDELVRIAHDYPSNYSSDLWFFDAYILASMLAGAFDLVSDIVENRYGNAWLCEIAIEASNSPTPVMRWNIRNRNQSRFVFNPDLFRQDHSIGTLLCWARTVPLFAAYHRADEIECGSVDVSLWDVGMVPGLVFCDSRPGHLLVPDPVFLHTEGYRTLRTELDGTRLPWSERIPQAFWRGTTTGMWDGHDWHTLPRVRLCEIGSESSGLLDAALSGVVQMPEPVEAEIRASDLMKPAVSPSDFARYKYQIDIDGNTNSWPGLFHKLYSGSTVLKIQSPQDYWQWYYDRLIPWYNFVPVSSDMSDLLAKIRWLEANDDKAQEIARRGHELAASLGYEAEMTRACPVITGAIRQHAYLHQ